MPVGRENLSKTRRSCNRKIRAVWRECASNIGPIRKAIKQFVPRLKAIEAKKGHSTKMLFG